MSDKANTNNTNNNINEIEEVKASEDMAEETEKHSRGVRVLAWILLGIYAVLLGVFIFFVVSGSQYILQMLFILIIYPVILYIIVWLRKVFDK